MDNPAPLGTCSRAVRQATTSWSWRPSLRSSRYRPPQARATPARCMSRIAPSCSRNQLGEARPTRYSSVTAFWAATHSLVCAEPWAISPRASVRGRRPGHHAGSRRPGHAPSSGNAYQAPVIKKIPGLHAIDAIPARLTLPRLVPPLHVIRVPARGSVCCWRAIGQSANQQGCNCRARTSSTGSPARTCFSPGQGREQGSRAAFFVASVLLGRGVPGGGELDMYPCGGPPGRWSCDQASLPIRPNPGQQRHSRLLTARSEPMQTRGILRRTQGAAGHVSGNTESAGRMWIVLLALLPWF